MASEPAHGPGGDEGRIDVGRIVGRDGPDPEGTGEAIMGVLGDGIGEALGLAVAVADEVAVADDVAVADEVGAADEVGVEVAEIAPGELAAKKMAARASATTNRIGENRGLMLFSLTK